MFTENGHNFTLSKETLNAIAVYMDDDIREDLHREFAPCEPDFFLSEYLKRDPSFAKLLYAEFGIEKGE